MTDFVQVQPYEVVSAWPRVRPLLQRAVEHDIEPPDFTCEELLVEIASGRQQLWVLPWKAVAMTQIQHFAGDKRSLMMTYCAGDDMDEWFGALWQKMREYKTAMGCRDIRAVGRPGWSRVFPDTVQKLTFLRET